MTSIVDFADSPAAPQPLRPAEDRILAGDPAQSATNHYSDPSGQFHCGIWESQPGRWRVRYTEHEVCHILAGRVVITGDDGTRRSYGPGDSFVIPAGFSGEWEVVEPARKLYGIFEPAA